MAFRVEATGLKTLARELRTFDDKALRNGLTPVYRDGAKLIRERAERAARSDVRRAIGHRANTRGAFLTLQPKPRYALAVFLGAKGRFGWYGARRYQASSARQFRPWIGQAWELADIYDIGGAIEGSIDEFIDLLGDHIEDLARRAFG